ncbi:hypothetical protein A4X13_0g2197 [Tilletia indica]|uniref:Midasin n=1 Tax=Tilletia indica TaxID=43049 RepID=A0A177TV73_9BASI|nr:hypothetical protein A4X13_0g2197 [Tilletia indica]
MDSSSSMEEQKQRTMEEERKLPSALNLDILTAAQRTAHILSNSAPNSPSAQHLHTSLIAAATDLSPTNILDLLAEALLIAPCTAAIAVLLRPILVDLTARWIPVGRGGEPDSLSWSQSRTQNIFHAFARLLYPLEEVYDCLHLFLTHPALEGKHILDSITDEPTAQAILISAWRLLYASPSLKYYLRFPILSDRLPAIWEDRASFSPTTCLLAIKVFSQLVGLPAATRVEYERRWVGDVSFSDKMAIELRHHSERRFTPVQSGSDGMDLDDEETDIKSSGVQAWATVNFEGVFVEEIDVWILPFVEFERTQDVWASFASIDVPVLSTVEGQSGNQLDVSDLHPLVVESAGVLLVRHSASPTVASSEANLTQSAAKTSDFVQTASAQSALFNLALLAAHRRPMLLTGAPACGKTSLIAHFCSQLADEGPERTILTIQLGDQSGVDAKQLLGSFISSPTNPGAFEWREGALTRAVRLGMWVVLEDIDRATTDVLQVVGQLVEGLTDTREIGRRPMLDLGTRGKIRAGKNFQLFATRSVPPSLVSKAVKTAVYPAANFLGANHWAETFMSPPDEKDIAEIVDTHLPLLAATGVSAHMISAWKRVQAFGSQAEASASSGAGAATSTTPAAGSRRTITLRDLLKWCQRIDTYLMTVTTSGTDVFTHTAHRERVLVEACDVFLSSIPAPSLATSAQTSAKGKAVDRYSALVNILADALQLSHEQAWGALRDRIPDFAMQTSHSGVKTMRLGRAKLVRAEQTQTAESSLAMLTGAAVPVSSNFAMTKTSLIMLEQIAMATSHAEPILLVGETGTGKTTLVQHLASLLHRPLLALNLSQQTESGDLLGGFKPLDPKIPASEVHNSWTVLFQRTFSAKRNGAFIEAERKAFMSAKWKRLIGLWRESARMAAARKRRSATKSEAEEGKEGEESESRKRRRTEKGKKEVEDEGSRQRELDAALDEEWKAFELEIDAFEAQHASKRKNFVFSFVEGPLVHALRNGHWILLDEINLAASEVLHCLSGLLQSAGSSVTLTDRGDTVPIVRHPDFRLFACMNPATDVGKKDLAMGLRQRFTELYIPSPDADIDALTSIVDKYIGPLAVGDRGVVMDAAEAYAQIQRLSRGHELADGANQRPHYSVRTLSRALRFAADTARVFGLRRALYEGFVMAFSMLLESGSLVKLMDVLQRNIIARAKNPRQVASLVPSMPTSTSAGGKDSKKKEYIQVGAFWLESGSTAVENVENYVLTPSVQDKLVGLARAVMTRKYPVLVQGPTSAGKTSAIEYLAKRTGHSFVRINNHEHTDVQEYLGTYATDPKTGQLVFREGLLVNALRHGHWIVLDELNLAPTDVLEALNRLLDDNRELIIPETGEIVRPHPHFMLFATQNPPGLYAGRKVLSRAFRNRFLEIHFDDVPQAELQTILADRCGIAPSYAAKMVSVFVELQKRRQTGRVFETKQAFVTLRDLFRWGQREAVGYQALAENGYMLIAERARRPDDKAIVKEVLEEVMNVSVNVDRLYDISSKSAKTRLGADLSKQLLASASSSQVVWTKAMTRLLYLVTASFRHNEPVLLVGETGTGKTSVCEAISLACGKELYTVNCHQNTDSADLLGGQRPLRNRSARRTAAEAQARSVLIKLIEDERATALGTAAVEDLLAELNSQLTSWTAEKESQVGRGEVVEARNHLSESMALFEWSDGPLVEAMRAGNHVLLDEISLADDSVLERLNSVLESGRSLVLTDGFVVDGQDQNDGVGSALLVAEDGFQIAATMNPGGDYGKKELSPALRNRFTEIWVPHVDEREDLLSILGSRWIEDGLRSWSEPILDFAAWINAELGGHPTMGIRDMIAWVVFLNNTAGSSSAILTPDEGFVHGALLTVVDGLGTIPATAHMSRTNVQNLRHRCLQQLSSVVSPAIVDMCAKLSAIVKEEDEVVRFGTFPLMKRALGSSETSVFSLTAASPALNAMRVVRGLCVPQKAILLEGSPGAGKTSLITALARVSRTPLTRINLSDQTELVDLFGSDLPVEGGGPGEFAWKDAAFLRAMVRGEWVLLDEMNLASQSVLEGLNSCLDHRGTVYVPELGRSFDKHPDFRIFAAQNPIGQGGGRKGLPQSFLNRFTKVYVQELTDADMLMICHEIFDYVDPALISDMIKFNAKLQDATMVKAAFGRSGMPWEFNLRDVLRWMLLLPRLDSDEQRKVAVDRMRSMYLDRFRTIPDREAAWRLFEQVFDAQPAFPQNPVPLFQPGQFQIGRTTLPSLRRLSTESEGSCPALLQAHLAAMDTLAESVKYGRLTILIGPAGSGKTSCVKTLAAAAGVSMEEIRMSPGMDTSDLLGSFEQEDPATDLHRAAQEHLARLAGKIAQVDTDAATLREYLAVQSALQVFMDSEEDLEPRISTLEQVGNSVRTDAEERRELAALVDLARRLCGKDGQGPRRFRWTDGPFLRALKEGRWLLLDDANLCPASVLDRFNSLFEDRGSLVLSERGMVDGEVPIVHPHPKFRAFMTIDPRYGELSRAMRNRGIEVCLPGIGQVSGRPSADQSRLQVLRRQPQFGSSSNSVSADETDALAIRRFSTDLSEKELQHSTGASLAFSRLHVESPDLFAPAISSASLSAPAGDGSDHVLTDTYSLQALGNFDHQAQLAAHIALRKLKLPQAQLVTEAISHSFLLLLQEASSSKPNPLQASNSMELYIYALLAQVRLQRILTSGEPGDISKLPVIIRSAFRNGSDDADSSPEDVIFSLLVALSRLLQTHAANATLSEASQAAALDVFDLSAFITASCQGLHVDYSALQIVQKTLQEKISYLQETTASHSDFTVVTQLLVHLASKVTLKRGVAMHAIWQMHLVEHLAETAQAARDQLILELRQSHQDHSPEVVKTAIDVAATLSCSASKSLGPEVQELIEVASRSLQTLKSSQPLEEDLDDSPISKFARQTESFKFALSAILIDGSVSDFRTAVPNIAADAKHKLVDLYCNSAANVPDTAVQLRALAWMDGRGSSDPTSSSTLAILQRLNFATSLEAQDTTIGLGHLFRPVFLQSALSSRKISSVSLKDLDTLKRIHQRSASMLGLALATQSQTVTAQLSFALAEYVGLLTQCVRDIAMESDSPAIRALATGLGSQIPDVITLQRELDGAKQAQEGITANTAQDDAVQHWLTCLRQVCIVLKNPSKSKLLAVGAALIKVVQASFHLYWPNVPVDPLAPSRVERDFYDIRSKRLSARLSVLQDFEDQTTGNTATALHRSLRKELSEASALQSASIAPVLDRASNLGELAQLHRDVFAFLQQVLDDQQLGRLIKELQDGFSSAGEARAATLRSSISNFRSRLPKLGAALKDVWMPLLSMFDMLLVGLTSLVEGARQAAATKRAKLGQAVVQASTAFPSAYSTAQLQILLSSDQTGLAKLGHTLSLLGLHSVLSLPMAARKRPEQLQMVDAMYAHIFNVWSEERQRQKQAAADAASIYKSRKEDIVVPSEEEIEEQEFQALFPDYGDGLTEVKEAKSLYGEVDVPSAISAEERLELLGLHLAFAGDGAAPEITLRKEAILQDLVEAHYSTLPQSVDRSSALFQMSMHSRWMHQVESSESIKEFYRESNPAEVQKAVPVVASLRNFLAKLLIEWPDQLVLQHIQDRCDAILSLRADLPVARILSALELLLAHTDDWESYANSKTSLGPHRDQITALIVNWRRLELGSWSALLDFAAAQQAGSVSDWWFSFYETTVLGSVDAAQKGPEAMTTHVRDVIKVVDDFMRSSTLGQYSSRLKLLNSFAYYFKERSASEPKLVAETMARVLGNLHSYFQQAEKSVTDSLMQQRKALEKDIATYAKLASWKDVNIHALKQSATKSHRRLHKTIRKFRSVLRQPVDPILAEHATPKSSSLETASTQTTLEEGPAGKLPSSEGFDWAEGKAHLVHLDRTLQVLGQLQRGQLRNVLQGHSAAGLQAIGIEIIQRTQQLAKATPANLTEENKKAVKQLTVRKQRAWVDLLKEQRRLGLSSYQNPHKLSILTDPVALFGVESPDSDALPKGLQDILKRAEQYHWRLLTSLPRSHDALQKRSEDVPVSDLLKGIHYVEHGAVLALNERKRLSAVITQLHGIGAVVSALVRLDESPEGQAYLLSANQTLNFARLDIFAEQALQVLKEVESEARGHQASSLFRNEGTAGFQESISSHVKQVQELQGELSSIIRHISAPIASAVLLKRDEDVVQRFGQTIGSITTDLDAFALKSPALSSLCLTSVQWLRTSLEQAMAPFQTQLTNGHHAEAGSLQDCSNRIIDSVLLIAQELRAFKAAEQESEQDSELPDGAIPTQGQHLRSIFSQLRADEMVEQIASLVRAAAQKQSHTKEVTHALQRVAPFLAVYHEMLKDHLRTSGQWYAELLKYLYIVNQTVQSVIVQGFCKPKEEQDSSDGDKGDDNAEAGTGLADGSGAQDITDQLEDDEEIEEMQRNEEEQDDNGGDTEKQEGAKESGLDLDGPTEEKEPDENGDDDQEEDQDDEEGEEPDDAIDKVDPLDPNAIDEKMWDGSHDEDKQDGGEVDDQQGGAEDELSAPKAEEGQEPQKNKDDQKADPKGEDEEKPADADAENQQVPEDMEDDQEDDGQGEEEADAATKPAPQLEDIQDGDVLEDIAELPDDGNEDMDMDDEEEMEELSDLQPEESEAKPDDMPFDEKDAKGEDELVPDDVEGEEDDNASENEDEGEGDGDAGDGPNSDDEAAADPLDVDRPDDAQQADTMMQEDQRQQTPPADDRQQQQAADEPQPQTSVLDSMTDTDPSAQMDRSSAATTGKHTEGAAANDQQQAPSQANQPQMPQDAEPEPQPKRPEDGAANEAGAPVPNQSDVAAEQPSAVDEEQRANPVRSLGDALEEFRRRLDEIRDASEVEDEAPSNEKKEDGQGAPELGEVEHVINDQDADTQALGAADDNQVQKLNETTMQDETKQDDRAAAEFEAQEDQSKPDALDEIAPERRSASDRQHKGALLSSEVQPQRNDIDHDVDRMAGVQEDEDEEQRDVRDQEEEHGPATEPERAEADAALQNELAILQGAGDEARIQKAAELWTAYTTLTADLSLALCEQLRLILAPTLASRLNGDFRTGKRLNMRKIIPFIASDFAKDKIWLRRTKPSAREYQVLLAIDDSKSMSETRSAHLAYQTLALVTGALARLEVGDVSVCRFGAEVETLHDFGKGSIGQEDGAKVIERLSFQQRSTNVLRLVEDSLRIMADARERNAASSSSAAELWQLQIIVSDGVCQDHGKLRAMLRRAAEQRVMLVFVVVDALHQSSSSKEGGEPPSQPSNLTTVSGSNSAAETPRNSILTMQQVSYQMGPDGKLDMRLERYLDTFPFEYYVVVRDVEALPDVLAETLRQWAEKIREGS